MTETAEDLSVKKSGHGIIELMKVAWDGECKGWTIQVHRLIDLDS